ncbi:MAG: tyrosine-type recombinase/integrase [Victivallales bacterium]|nr:tyrosine-type recombinase/integrase [Victivallales bacterium]
MARKKGAGSIRRRGDSFYHRIKIDGKEKITRLKATNLEDAEKEVGKYQIMAEAQSDIEVAFFVGRQKNIIQAASGISVREAFSKFKQNSSRPECTDKTLGQHERCWQDFTGWLSVNHPQAINLKDIDEAIAVDYFNYVASIKNPRTFNQVRNTLKLMLRTLERGNNPFATIRKKHEDTKVKKEFTLEQLENIFRIIPLEGLSLMYRAEMELLFYLGAYTGLRLKDCCLLRWECYSRASKIIRVVPEKTKKTKTITAIPVHPRLIEALAKAEAWKVNEYILPETAKRYQYNSWGVTKDAKRIIDYAMWEQPEKYRKPPSVPGYGFHSLRHTFVSICANAGVPLSVVQEIVGHGSPAMTRHYTHVADDSLRKAIDTLPSGAGGCLSDREKLEQIKAILDGKTRLTAAEKEIISILK